MTEEQVWVLLLGGLVICGFLAFNIAMFFGALVNLIQEVDLYVNDERHRKRGE